MKKAAPGQGAPSVKVLEHIGDSWSCCLFASACLETSVCWLFVVLFFSN